MVACKRLSLEKSTAQPLTVVEVVHTLVLVPCWPSHVKTLIKRYMQTNTSSF